jgi:flavin reductase (DIM6/NTAB) family NADH-FMN oxidoreductase RutF
MIHFEPKDLPVPKVHQYLIGGIGPRPIALVSTLSENGIPNLTPFSFFNAFGANPPIIAFSPSRRGRSASLKDSYINLMKTRECVVQVVTYSIVEQVNIASAEYPFEVNEFEKSGLTPINSDLVKPFRVKESPFQMECIMKEMRSFSEKGSAANIAICEVIKFHIAEDIIDDGIICPDSIDLVGRMGADYYCRATGTCIFELPQPRTKLCVGYDNLPNYIKQSHVFSANNIGKLASVERIPGEEESMKFLDEVLAEPLSGIEITEEAFYRYQRLNKYTNMLKVALNLEYNDIEKKKLFVELIVKCALENNDVQFAWNTVHYLRKLNSIND